jgi:sec-independent protein translocase protein TatA
MELAFLEAPELIIVLVVVLVLFGGSRLPGLARSLGEAQRELRKASRDDEGDGDGAPASGSKADPPPPGS